MNPRHVRFGDRRRRWRRLMFGGGALGLTVAMSNLVPASATTTAKSASTFYIGKSITLVVGSSPGGGQDAQARVLAEYLPQYIPGHPSITVMDVPANSGTVGMTEMQSVFPANGLYIDLTDGSLPLKQLFKVSGASYNIGKMSLIASYEGSGPVIVRTGKGATPAAVKTASQGTPLVAAAVSAGSLSSILLNLGLAFLKIPYKDVYGYSSNGPIALAFKGGSADAAAVSLSAYIASFEPNNDSYGLYQFGFLSKNGQNLVADPFDKLNGQVVPTIEAVWQQLNNTKKTPTGGVWQSIKRVAALNAISDELVMRQGSPNAAVTALQEGFSKMEKSSDFQAAAARLIGEPIRGLSITLAHKALLAFLHTPQSEANLVYSESGLAS